MQDNTEDEGSFTSTFSLCAVLIHITSRCRRLAFHYSHSPALPDLIMFATYAQSFECN